MAIRSFSPAGEPLAPIAGPYLMVLFSVPFHLDDAGRRYIDPLWAKDLAEHTKYISRLTLAACAERGPAPAGFVCVDEDAALASVRCVNLPKPKNSFDLRAILGLARILWRELTFTEVVHSSIVGWPVPEAWLIVPMLWFKTRKHLIVVESASWRIPPGTRAGLQRRIRAAVSEQLNRLCIGQADLAFFTQSQYLQSLLRRRTDRGLLVEASWVNADAVLNDFQAEAALAQRRGGPLKLVFAGRLCEAKAPLILIEAIAELVDKNHALTLDIYGDGPQRQACRELIRLRNLEGQVAMRGLVAYGAPFFSVLRGHDVLIVPSISDEQPRIVYDAYSQAVPVIASNTAGLRQCVTDASTGLLFEAGDTRSLASSIARAIDNRHAIEDMSRNCVLRARGATHQAMHVARWQAISRLLGQG